MDGDGRLIHALASHPPQQLHVSLQVAPKELWQVLGTDTHFDKLGQPLHGTLGNYKVQRSIEAYKHYLLYYLIVAAGPEEGGVHECSDEAAGSWREASLWRGSSAATFRHPQ